MVDGDLSFETAGNVFPLTKRWNSICLLMASTWKGNEKAGMLPSVYFYERSLGRQSPIIVCGKCRCGLNSERNMFFWIVRCWQFCATAIIKIPPCLLRNMSHVICWQSQNSIRKATIKFVLLRSICIPTNDGNARKSPWSWGLAWDLTRTNDFSFVLPCHTSFRRGLLRSVCQDQKQLTLLMVVNSAELFQVSRKEWVVWVIVLFALVTFLTLPQEYHSENLSRGFFWSVVFQTDRSHVLEVEWIAANIRCSRGLTSPSILYSKSLVPTSSALNHSHSLFCGWDWCEPYKHLTALHETDVNPTGITQHFMRLMWTPPRLTRNSQKIQHKNWQEGKPTHRHPSPIK